MHLLQLTVSTWETYPQADACGRPGQGHMPGMDPGLIHAVNRHDWAIATERPHLVVYVTSESAGGTVVGVMCPTDDPQPSPTTEGRYCLPGVLLDSSDPTAAALLGGRAPLSQHREKRRVRDFSLSAWLTTGQQR
ncbi:hypothetical protein P3T37_004354 [Kitasatospora sp. MAA4]|uniref:hypothetical protein n=1 Tax=Kitasatospora sp. MAA4 TaxID=3035093 RepID=UPI0024752569|nr:hypothetical protein [Kitasatospora sp. MAA4]MDH6134945.1 hypothetical protein [Kitasatospora sp. MAA4]